MQRHRTPRASPDVPRSFVMRPTRLQDALLDASDLHDENRLDLVYARIAAGQRRARPRPRPQSPCAHWSLDHEALARTAVTTQVAAIEAQCQQHPSDVASIHDAIESELPVSCSSSDPLQPRSAGLSTWYAMGNVLGTGTFGRVHVARHRVIDARVAVKSYYREKGATVCSPPPSLAKSARTRAPTAMTDALEWKRVRQEVRLMASLAPHAGIVGFLEAFETPTQLQVVMEFVGGGSLCDLLKLQPHQRLSEAAARRVFGDLCRAVDALHDQNVIHRDLKLENVLLDDDRRPRLVDFGFSQRDDDSIKNFCGTPSYMAPEVVACKRYDGKRVDVWSLGIILYVLLCGKFPFQGTNLHHLYQTIRSTTLAFPSTVSQDAQHLIQRMLVIDPLKRLTLAAALDHVWMRPQNQGDVVGSRAVAWFVAWEDGLSMLCHTLARLYGVDAATLVASARGDRRSSVAAMLRVSMLAAERQFSRAVEASTTPAAVGEPPPPYETVSGKKQPLVRRPPPSPRSPASRTHKQQLEQLIGLVQQSLT